MNVLIIEDEPHAARQLVKIIEACRPAARITSIIDTVEGATRYLQADPAIDLIFLDIHLSDGHSFGIFDQVEVLTPIIFTTAYDQYAIRAFDVNSIDYLLKPATKEKVEKSISKFEKHWASKPASRPQIDIAQLKLLLQSGGYRENFLVPFKDQLLPVAVKDFAWFEVKNGRIVGATFDKTSLVLDERSIDELVQQLDPRQFYRANRQFLINREAVKSVTQYLNGKLLAGLHPAPPEAVVISREKATGFKLFMGS